MNAIQRTIVAIFLGAVLNAVLWFLLGIIDVLLFRERFELLVPVTAAIIGLIIGVPTGGIIGVAQPRTKTVVVAGFAVLLLITLLLMPLFYDSVKNEYLFGQKDYGPIFLHLAEFVSYLLVSVCASVVVSKIVGKRAERFA